MSAQGLSGAGKPAAGALGGARVALFEARMEGQLAGLVRRHGGVPFATPVVREVALDTSEPVRQLIDALAEGSVETVVCLTGAGLDTLFGGAEKLGRAGELEEGLRRATTVCRGHKPRAALRRRGLDASLLVREPFTTREVIDALEALNPRDQGVAVVHYGERNPAIVEALQGMGSRVLDVCVYEWALPEDTGPAAETIDRILGGGFDAAAFTSQVQIRHLLRIARGLGRESDLVRQLDERVVVAAVGPTCADALRAAGVTPRVVPENPKMGPMVVALAEYLRRECQSLHYE